MVLSVCENENGQTTTASEIIDASSIDAHVTVGIETGADYLEESDDEDLSVSEDNKNCHEVLCLGKLPGEEFADFSAYANIIDTEQTEELSFVGQVGEVESEITMVSTACDYTVAFTVVSEVKLRPGELTKVHLQTQHPVDPEEDFQAILLGNTLPEFVRMDNALINVSDTFCTTFVCTSSDKTLTLTTNSKFCKGIVVTNPLITIGEHTFSTYAASGLETEVNETDFPEHCGELIKILRKFRETVAIKGDKLGRTDVLQHKIILEEGAKPFFIPNYRLPISTRATVDSIVEEMKSDGIVVPSNSLYNSPLLLVPKKDSSWRLVIDFRNLNSQTVPDRLPMPVVSDVPSQLGGAQVFSSVDLLSGYWQVPMADESKPLTVFSTHKDHLQFEVMLFGLTAAPLTFVCLMQQVLGDLVDVMVYLDDIISFSKDITTHFKTLQEILHRLQGQA